MTQALGNRLERNERKIKELEEEKTNLEAQFKELKAKGV